MNTYYEYIRTHIKGMISSSYMDLFELNLDFNAFIEYLEKMYQISGSNFDYHIFYDNVENEAKKDYSHYVTLDNGIYVEITTCSKNEIESDIMDMSDTIIHNVIAYSSQDNNKKLIKFMNDVNSFIIKNKKKIDNV